MLYDGLICPSEMSMLNPLLLLTGLSSTANQESAPLPSATPPAMLSICPWAVAPVRSKAALETAVEAQLVLQGQTSCPPLTVVVGPYVHRSERTAEKSSLKTVVAGSV